MTTIPVLDKSSCKCVDILTNYKRIGDTLMEKNNFSQLKMKR